MLPRARTAGKKRPGRPKYAEAFRVMRLLREERDGAHHSARGA